MERLLLECAIRSTLIIAAATVVLFVMRIKNAEARHSIWTAVLVLSLALPVMVASGHTVPLRILPPVLQNVEQIASYSGGTTPSILLQAHPTLEESPRIDTKRGFLVWPEWIEGTYIFGVAILLIRLVTGMIGAYRIRRQARLVDGRLTSAACSCPITVGFVHAVTILPEGWHDWEPAKLDAVLIHESQHARRFDPLVQCLALLNRAIFWFHPLSWWLERRLTTLSEEACDIVVLERGHSAGDYSRYLLDLARSVSDSRRRIRVLGMAMPGAYLPKRIQKILLGGLPPRVSFSRMIFASAVFFLLSTGLSTTTPVRSQSTKATEIRAEMSSMRLPQVPGPLAFEAASVKPTSPGSGITWGSCHGTDRARQSIASRILQGMSPPEPPALGRCLITRASLKQIVVEAYDLGPTIEITGGPGWFDSDRFDIDAKAEDPSRTTVAQLQQMLQQLLADRFKLKLHREDKEVSGSLLGVAGNGAKLKEAAASDGPPRGGRPGDMNFRGATMPILAEFLSQAMGRPVQDETGLTGRYTFNLKWALTETDSVQPEFVQPPDPSGPSLVTALQEQLGLRLQSGKVPVFIVVIDSAEKPLPN